MSRIRSKDTKPELIVRSLLHRSGIRFSLHGRGIPGAPDLILRKYKTVIFVHGCFWHQHEGCIEASKPKTRSEYWQSKLSANLARDRRNQDTLVELGWNIIIVWECEVLRDPVGIIQKIREELGLPAFTFSGVDRRSILKESHKKLIKKLGS